MKNVYQIIPKLGVKTNKVTYHELFGDSETQSIFPQNSIPENSSLTTAQIAQLVDVNESRFVELVTSKLKQHSAYKQFVTKDGELKYTSLRYYPIKHEGMAQKDDAYLSDDEQFVDNIETFATEEQAMDAAMSGSDFVINIGNNDAEALNSYKTDNYTSKDIDAIVEQINSILQSSEAPTDNMLDNINILITVGPDILNQKMPKDTIQQAIEIESNRVRNMLMSNSDTPTQQRVEIERKLEQTKKMFESAKEGTELYDWFNKKANMIRFGAFVDALYSRLTGLSEMININVVGENSASDVLIMQAKRGSVNYTLYSTTESTNDNSSVADDMNVPEDMVNGYLEDLSNITNSVKKKVQKEESDIGKQIQQTMQEVKNKDSKSIEQYSWARYSRNGYEVSTAGDSRFSALTAKFKSGTIIEGIDVGGKTIEYVYQNIIKKSGKGKAPAKDSIINKPVKESELTGKALNDRLSSDKSNWSYRIGYLPLWQEWAKQNPELIAELAEKSKGKILTDKFAKTQVSQARALAEILNNQASDQNLFNDDITMKDAMNNSEKDETDNVKKYCKGE